MRKNILTAMIVLIAGAVLMPAASLAGKLPLRGPVFGFSHDYSYDVITKKPIDGYEGPPGPGISGYCSYYKIPIRKCVVASNGKQHCYAAAWTLHQFCNTDSIY